MKTLPPPHDTLALLSSDVDDNVFYIPLRKPSSDSLDRWRKATLRSTIHAVLAADRLRKVLKRGSTPLLEEGLPTSVQELRATDLDALVRVSEAPTNSDPQELECILRSLGDIPHLAGDFCIEQQSPPQAMGALLSREHVMDVPCEFLSSNNINSPMLSHHFNPEHATTIPVHRSSGGRTFDATVRGIDPMMALDHVDTVITVPDPALTRQSAPVFTAILAAKTGLAIGLLSISATILLQGGVKGSSKTRAGLILSGLYTISLLVTSLCSFLYILMEIFILFAVGRNMAWQDGNADTNSHPRIRTIANLCFVVSASALPIDLIVGVLSKLNSKGALI